MLALFGCRTIISIDIIIIERENGTLEVTVHQKVTDLQGKSLYDGHVKHVYTLKEGLLKKMEIEVE